MNDIRKHVIKRVYKLGVANLPMGDTRVAGAFLLEAQAKRVLEKIIPGARPPGSELGDNDHQLASYVHLYTSNATIWILQRMLKSFGMDRIVRALTMDANSQLTFPFACLALPATMVSNIIIMIDMVFNLPLVSHRWKWRYVQSKNFIFTMVSGHHMPRPTIDSPPTK